MNQLETFDMSASDASGRQIRYYAAGEGKRKWYESDTYCCPGNYRRIMGGLPGFIVRPHQESPDVPASATNAITCSGWRPIPSVLAWRPANNNIS